MKSQDLLKEMVKISVAVSEITHFSSLYGPMKMPNLILPLSFS